MCIRTQLLMFLVVNAYIRVINPQTLGDDVIYEFQGQTHTNIWLAPKCVGVRSTVQCCLNLADDNNAGTLKDGPRRMSIGTIRVRTRTLVFMCLKLTRTNKSRSLDVKYQSSYYGPLAIQCMDNQVARLRKVMISNLIDRRTGFWTEFMIGHCVDRDLSKLSHFVTEGRIDCLVVTRIHSFMSEDNVIYAWFTDNDGQFLTVNWAQIRNRTRRNYKDDPYAIETIKIQRWSTETIAYHLIYTDILLEYEVCIFARTRTDTIINIRIGDLGEEDWPFEQLHIEMNRFYKRRPR